MPKKIQLDLQPIQEGTLDLQPIEDSIQASKSPTISPTSKTDPGFKNTTLQIAKGMGDAGLSALAAVTGISPAAEILKRLGVNLPPQVPTLSGQAQQLAQMGADQLGQFGKTYAAGRHGRYAEAAGYAWAGLLPLMGPAAAQAGENLGQGATGAGAAQAGALLAPALSEVPLRAMKAVAPQMAETALGIGNKGRAFGRTPGEAALKETSGLTPASVADSAHQALNRVGQQIGNDYRSAGINGQQVSLQPALDVLEKYRQQAIKARRTSLAKDIQANMNRLSTDPITKQTRIDMMPEELWNIKSGQGDLTNWNPNADPRLVSRIEREVYHAMDSELDRVSPQTSKLNQGYSSLKQVYRRADIESRNAPFSQRLAQRVAARTGALVASAFLGGHYGIPGYVAGVLIPELIGDPTAQMAAARAMNTAGAIAPSAPLATPIAAQSIINKSPEER